jgi:hypothetical protein
MRCWLAHAVPQAVAVIGQSWQAAHRNTLTPRAASRAPLALSGVAVSLQNMGTWLLDTHFVMVGEV